MYMGIIVTIIVALIAIRITDTLFYSSKYGLMELRLHNVCLRKEGRIVILVNTVFIRRGIPLFLLIVITF